jgi:hypothetical protein
MSWIPNRGLMLLDGGFLERSFPAVRASSELKSGSYEEACSETQSRKTTCAQLQAEDKNLI